MCEVFPFHEGYESIKNVPVVQAVTAYDDDRRFTHLLVLNEALSFGRGMNHSFINPNQIRMKQVPTEEDLNTLQYHILTNDALEWDPPNVDMSAHQSKGEELCMIRLVSTGNHCQSCHKTDVSLSQISGAYLEKTLVSWLIASVNVSGSYINWDMWSPGIAKAMVETLLDATASSVPLPGATVSEVISKHRHSIIMLEHSCCTWNIGLDMAKKTLQVTTQYGMRTDVHPLHWRYRVDHLDALNKKRLRQQWYMDHLVSKTISINSNTGAW
eukprot:924748-Ditylum_brightwellii.AAC.1